MKPTIVRFVLLVLALVPGTVAATPGSGERITIFATCDFHGEMSARVQPWSGGEPVGGAAALSGYLAITESRNPGGVVFVDAGDLMQGTLVSGKYRGVPVTRAFHRMGVAGVCVGNHEFDWGLAVLRSRGNRVPFLAANIETDPGVTPAWEPFRVVVRKGVRIGLIGVANPETPELTTPSAVAGLTFTDPAKAVIRTLPSIDADVVVVLAHLGGYGTLTDLANALDPARVHLIVGGHSHEKTTGVVNGIPILQPWPKSTGFGVVDITVNADGRVVDATYPWARTTWTMLDGGPAVWRGSEVVPAPRVARLVRQWERRVAKSANRIVGRATGPLTRNYRRESSMGNWVADVVRAGPPAADFGIVNSGGLRADIDEGEVTFGEVFDVMPFDNRLVHVLVSGAALREVLEMGVTGKHGVVQVSGLRFEFDYDRPAGERILGDVIDAATDRPLLPTKLYRVAVPDFLADGGDGFVPFAEAKHERQDALIRDLMVTWLRQRGPLAPPRASEERRMPSRGTAP